MRIKILKIASLVAILFAIIKFTDHVIKPSIPTQSTAAIIKPSIPTQSTAATLLWQPSRLKHKHVGDTFAKNTYLENSRMEYSCKLQSRVAAAGSSGKRSSTSTVGNLATAIVFQSNAANQLQNFMTHHIRVIGNEYIVIIDHQADRKVADPYTASLLEEYNTLGSDVWQCDGKWTWKAEILSDVIHQYTHSSKFVFPLDVDEVLSVKKKKKGAQEIASSREAADWSNSNNWGLNQLQYEDEILSWNGIDFSNALNALPDLEKPFKMEGGRVLPADCGPPYDRWRIDSSVAVTTDVTTNDTSIYLTSKPTLRQHGNAPIQRIKYVERDRTRQSKCHDKMFMRGKDFNKTDAGNHIGATHKFNFKAVDRDCTKRNVTTYVPGQGKTLEIVHHHEQDRTSGLFLIHLQTLNFEEWLLHALRGASDMNFNHFPNPNPECTGILANFHYCWAWNNVVEARFDPKKMKELYRNEICRHMAAYKTPVRVDHLFNIL